MDLRMQRLEVIMCALAQSNGVKIPPPVQPPAVALPPAAAEGKCLTAEEQGTKAGEASNLLSRVLGFGSTTVQSAAPAAAAVRRAGSVRSRDAEMA